MSNPDADDVQRVVQELDSRIDWARGRSLEFVADLLDMARLELLSHQYRIDEDELSSLSFLIESQQIQLNTEMKGRRRNARASMRRRSKASQPSIYSQAARKDRQ